MKPIEQQIISRQQIDQWPVTSAGLNIRVVNCLEQAGVHTVGELRSWRAQQLLLLRSFGAVSMRNVRWFFNWAKRLEAGNGDLPDFRTLLREFLDRSELHVIEQRYGLSDPLFRPQMRRRTLRDIAAGMRGGVTRERVRQIEEAALTTLRANLARAVAESQDVYWVNRIQARGCVVTAPELAEWADDPRLGGYQPWGVLLLLSEIDERIRFRHGFFTSLPPQTLNQVEKQILQLLHEAHGPVPFERIVASVEDELGFLNGQRPRFVTVLLDHHPDISGTLDRQYFLPATGAGLILADILNLVGQPLHFRELTRRYNERMLPHSRRGTGYILRVLQLMPDAQRVTPAVYQLKPR